MDFLRSVLSVSGVMAILLTACGPAATPLLPAATETRVNSDAFNPQAPHIRTATLTATQTDTATATLTATKTLTATASNTHTPSATPTITQTFTTTVTETASATLTATALPTTWHGTYYKGSELVLTRDDEAINFNWGSDAPAASVPSDHFWIHWERVVPFAYGTYRFHAHSDDGVRVWLNDQAIIDEWHDSSAATYYAERTLEAGTYTVRVDYYENSGGAQIQFWWERLDEMLDWRGEYYANQNLYGSPTLVRNDWLLDFAWGLDAPDSRLSNDGFSARWVRTLDFGQGLYEFHAIADDGVRLWVDNQLIVDDWNDGGQRDHTAKIGLGDGLHTIQVEYYEHVGEASIRLTWQRVGDAPTSTPTNTPTSSN